ncbi:hypothetical protein E8E13_008040 [Curvularia kusanoi]|uniref:SUN domain-containing protein n=1 Tax=Curvularia kusanoi TaxID=90978 RepID=A0A9P4TFN7_CURKU|nr:hypothetical protein E8E13_008040 [Curvularia kusanoi]
MSQSTGLGGPTPRRSTRLSSKAGSAVEQSVVTTMTSGGTRKRRQGPLTKVKARPSNAYGASGRVGAAEELSVPATGFASAFQERRGNAVTRDDDIEEEDDSDSDDELGNDFMMSGALNGTDGRRSPAHERSSPPPRVPAPFTFSETPDLPFTDDDLALSIGATSKSFGMEHEAGMLQEPQRRSMLRSSSQQPTPAARGSERLVRQVTKLQTTVKATPGKTAIDHSVDDLLAQERARLKREGPPRPALTPQAASRPTFASQVASRPAPVPAINPSPRAEVTQRSQMEQRAMLPPRSPAERSPELRTDSRGSLHQTVSRTARKAVDKVDQWLPGLVRAGSVMSSEILEDEPESPWAQPLLYVFWGLVALLGIILGPMLVSAAMSDPTRKVGMHTALASRISTAWYDTAEWIMPGPRYNNDTPVILSWLEGKGTMDDHLIWSRMWKNHKEYAGKFDAIDSAIEKIKEDLPELIVVRRHPDEHLEITDDFWNALLSKANSKSNDATWMEFLKANSQKVQSIDSTPIYTGKPEARPQIVGREEFVSAMRKHYDTISTDVEQKITEALKTHETQIKTLIQAEARKTLMDSIRLQSLAQSNLIANYELNLMKPNYFSPGLGALIDPGRTSSTFSNSSSSLVGRYLGRVRRAFPPIAALTRWEEFGDCWCASPNPIRGYARLAVSLPRRVFPKQVTVEHAPMSMSPTGNIKNAPRNIELWAETSQPIKHLYGDSYNKCLDPGDLRGLGYVCLGAFKYNIHASNHVQTFDLDAELTSSTSRVVVQVTSNWGAPNTCIYRVRLHGDDAEEKPNYDVTLND